MNFDEEIEKFGDPHAVQFCKVLYRFIHLLDDLVDGDKKRDADEISGLFFALLAQLSKNPFWLRHHATLLPVLYSSSRAWAASERLRTSENLKDRVAAEYLKSQYQDVFFMVAALLDGNCNATGFALNWELSNRGYTPG